MNVLQKTVGDTVKHVKEKAALAVMTANIAMSTAFCAKPTGSIASVVDKIGILVFGIIELIGIFNLVLGGVGIAKSFNDDEHGSDQNGISKGVKKLIAGAVMVFGPWLILGWIGISNPMKIGTFLFGDL